MARLENTEAKMIGVEVAVATLQVKLQEAERHVETNGGVLHRHGSIYALESILQVA